MTTHSCLQDLLEIDLSIWQEKIAATIFNKDQTLEELQLSESTRNKLANLLAALEGLPREWAKELCTEVIGEK